MIAELHEVLHLERPLIGIDEETTGVQPKTSAIVELGLEIMIPGQPVKEYRTLINPMMPIPAAATAIHGITNEMVRGCRFCSWPDNQHWRPDGDVDHDFKPWPTFVQIAEHLAKSLVGCDFAGYNVFFDLNQIAEEFKRAGKVWSFEGARIIDAFRMWQLAEGRTLTHAAERWLAAYSSDADIAASMGESAGGDSAHNALWDIKMSTRVAAAQLLNCDHLPRDIQQLHDLQWPGLFDAEKKLRWNDGELCFTFGEHRDKPLRYVVKNYPNYLTGFILKKDFSDKVKDACRNALQGNYPVAP